MKKSVKSSLQKTKERFRMEEMLAIINEEFTIEITEQDFDQADKSFCHFHLTETPGWLYGIWIKGEQVYMFGDFEEIIEDFNPDEAYFDYQKYIMGFMEKVHDISERPEYYIVEIMGAGQVAYPYYEVDGHISGYQVIEVIDPTTGLTFKVWDDSITQEDYITREYQAYLQAKQSNETLVSS